MQPRRTNTFQEELRSKKKFNNFLIFKFHKKDSSSKKNFKNLHKQPLQNVSTICNVSYKKNLRIFLGYTVCGNRVHKRKTRIGEGGCHLFMAWRGKKGIMGQEINFSSPSTTPMCHSFIELQKEEINIFYHHAFDDCARRKQN